MSDGHVKFDFETRQFERRVLLLVALVQFINIWDFMLVMPLGPDFSRALGVDVANLGWIAGSYSIAAAVVGLLAARYIDRFDRRAVMLFCLSGMAVTTLAMVLADTITDLITLRALTGAFGGPVIASSMAIVADVFPDNRRGEAVGKVFASFSLAAVLGVPVSLEIAHYYGWWAPFVAVSAVAVVTMFILYRYLPPMRAHLDGHTGGTLSFSFLSGIRNPAMVSAAVLTAFSTFAAFLLIPNISAHVQQNMGYPRAWLGFLYFCGGGAAFFSMRVVGRRSDRFGYARSCGLATVILWGCVWLWFYRQVGSIPAPMYFIFFMICMSTRNVTSNALISKIPLAHERAGFMSVMSSVQHLMSGVGAMASTLLLVETADGRMQGMEQVALLAMLAFTVMPLAMFHIEKILASRLKPA